MRIKADVDLNNKPGTYYGYIVVLCSFFVIFAAMGIYYSFGIFFNSLLADFGWSRAVTSVGYSLGGVLSGILGIFAGRVTDRFGPRVTGITSGIFLALGCFLMSKVTEVWQFYLVFGIAVGVGVGGTMVPLTSTVSRWFVQRRGVMTGIVTSGIGTGTLVFPILVNWLLSIYDWRTSFAIVGIVALVLIIPAAMFLKRDPSTIGQFAYQNGQEVSVGPMAKKNGLTISESIRTTNFWIICTIYFFIGYFSQTILVHIVPHAKALGITASAATVILSLIGAGSIVGRIIIGNTSDKTGVRITLIISLGIAVLGLLCIQVANELWKLYLIAPIIGFAYGGLIAMLAITGAKMFGVLAVGAIVGVIMFLFSIGGAVGPIISGYIFDTTGSYNLAFLICFAVMTVALILCISLRESRRVRKE